MARRRNGNAQHWQSRRGTRTHLFHSRRNHHAPLAITMTRLSTTRYVSLSRSRSSLSLSLLPRAFSLSLSLSFSPEIFFHARPDDASVRSFPHRFPLALVRILLAGEARSLVFLTLNVRSTVFESSLAMDTSSFRNTRFVFLSLSLSLAGCPSLFFSPFTLGPPGRSVVGHCRAHRRNEIPCTSSRNPPHSMDEQAPPSLALLHSRPFVARDDARCTTRSTRRTRTHARTHVYLYAVRGRDATSVRTTTSTSPPYAFVAAIFVGDTMAKRGTRNACAYMGVCARGRCAR